MQSWARMEKYDVIICGAGPAGLMTDIASIATMRTKLQELETTHKNNLAAASKVRGDTDLGYLDS